MRPVFLGALLIGLTAAAFAAPAPVPQPRKARLLVASSDKGGNWDIYLVDPDTGKVKNLTKHEAKDTDPTWSPDGKRIAFVSDRGGAPELWVMGADGSAPRAVSRDTVGCWRPRWSPDGKRIAFVLVKGPRRAGPARQDVCTVDPATGNVTALTADGVDGEPAWSPDGKGLAYVHYGDARWALRTMGADGIAKRDVGGADGGSEPAWSPDGKRIAFVSQRGGMGSKLYVCDSDGYGVKDLGAPASPTTPAASPRWSPDGKRIAFRDWDAGKEMCQIAVVGADGKGRKVLTAGAPHADPRWSADGKSLSYGRFRDYHGYLRGGIWRP